MEPYGPTLRLSCYLEEDYLEIFAYLYNRSEWYNCTTHLHLHFNPLRYLSFTVSCLNTIPIQSHFLPGHCPSSQLHPSDKVQ